MQSKIVEILELLKEKFNVDFEYELTRNDIIISDSEVKLDYIFQHLIYDVIKMAKEKLNIDYAYVLDSSKKKYILTKSYNKDELI